MKRYKFVDVAKGLGILLVVLGHSIPKGYPAYQDVLLFNVIYSFHMPLFFVLSGYVMIKKLEVLSFKNSLKKVRRLFIPYLIWHSLYPILSIGLIAILINPLEFYRSALISPDAPWFLHVLFFCSIIGLSVLSVYTWRKNYRVLVVFFLINLFINIGYKYSIITFNIGSSLQMISNYMLYLQFGFILERVISIKRRGIQISLTLGSLVGFTLLHILISNYLHFSNLTILYLWELTIAVSGSMTIIFASKFLENLRIGKLLIKLGMSGFEIYLLNGFFLNLGIGTDNIKVVTTFITSFVATIITLYLLQYLSKRNLYLSKIYRLFFGTNNFSLLSTNKT